MGYSLLFALMWVGLSISSAVAGTRLDAVTHSVVAIDCTVLLPLLFFGGLLLWRRRFWGYVLGGLLLVKMATTGFTLAFTTALGAWWAQGIDPFNAFLFVLFALVAIGSVALLVFPTCVASEEGDPALAVTVLTQRDLGWIAGEERVRGDILYAARFRRPFACSRAKSPE